MAVKFVVQWLLSAAATSSCCKMVWTLGAPAAIDAWLVNYRLPPLPSGCARRSSSSQSALSRGTPSSLPPLNVACMQWSWTWGNWRRPTGPSRAAPSYGDGQCEGLHLKQSIQTSRAHGRGCILVLVRPHRTLRCVVAIEELIFDWFRALSHVRCSCTDAPGCQLRGCCASLLGT